MIPIEFLKQEGNVILGTCNVHTFIYKGMMKVSDCKIGKIFKQYEK